MSSGRKNNLRLEYRDGGVHLPELGLWLDGHLPVLGSERVFVSHAHSDHTAEHREMILSERTRRLMEARLPGMQSERMQTHVLEFGERRSFEPGFAVTLLPAGHILGSAMCLIEEGGAETRPEGGVTCSYLYTGDFKLRRGRSAEACEPRSADVLIMETTFGRPNYVFPPTEEVMAGVIGFCREALDNDETPVLMGYSLGKSQEVLCGLAEAGLPVMLHESVYRLTKIYEQLGVGGLGVGPDARWCSGPVAELAAREAGSTEVTGKVLVCPPQLAGSALLRRLGRVRTAILTGWAMDSGCRYRYRCDAAFPLSDHADFPQLVELVRQVNPKRVYTLHGFAADFASTLRGMGYEAWALSEDEQLELEMGRDGAGLQPRAADRGRGQKPKVRGQAEARIPDEDQTAADAAKTRSAERKTEKETSLVPFSENGPLFRDFAERCASIGAESGKLEKVRLLAEYLQTIYAAEAGGSGARSDVNVGVGMATVMVCRWFSGRVFGASENKVLKVGWAVVRDSVCAATDTDDDEFHHVYLKYSDLGRTAEELAQKDDQAMDPEPGKAWGLTVAEVMAVFQALLGARGPLGKVPVLRAALQQCSPLEARYLVKVITGDLRIGLKEGLVEEAVAAAFGQKAEAVRQAALLSGDIGTAAKLAAEGRLGEATIEPFRPVKFMLASPEETAQAIWDRREADSKDQQPTRMVWVEDKYDGIRCQLHRRGGRVALYSRDLKEITSTFPELADSVSSSGLVHDFILDGEIVAMRGEEVLPFADLQRRLGRREGDLFMREEVPIQYVTFDLLWLNGQGCLNLRLSERRAKLEAVLGLPTVSADGEASSKRSYLRVARVARVGSAEELEREFVAARARGNEGLMVKDPGSAYTPGRRGLAWLKLKKPGATLDCVVVGAEYGHGKRSQVLSDYTFAVRDEASGELRVVGKAYTGLTDVEIAELTAHFLRRAARQRGRYFEVPPEVVLEVAFDRMQLSNRHDSGVAMRFPRIVRIRRDKSVGEIDTLERARGLARGGGIGS